MRIVKDVEIPETLGEAKPMTYEKLKKACEFFNNYGISAEDMQKQWAKQLDNQWWDGFDAAINFSVKVIVKSHWGTQEMAIQLEDEAKLYKKEISE